MPCALCSCRAFSDYNYGVFSASSNFQVFNCGLVDTPRYWSSFWHIFNSQLRKFPSRPGKLWSSFFPRGIASLPSWRLFLMDPLHRPLLCGRVPMMYPGLIRSHNPIKKSLFGGQNNQVLLAKLSSTQFLFGTEQPRYPQRRRIAHP